MQRALIKYRNPKNYELVMEALRKTGREDLIGFGKHCLIRPRQTKEDRYFAKKRQQGKGSALPKKKKTIRNTHKKKKH